MTIVSALVCKEAIIMASDSRTTNLDSTIRDDTRKIDVINLSDGFGALVGQSGNADLGARAVEIMRGMAEAVPMTEYRTVADLAEKAVGELKQKIRLQFAGSAEEQQKHFEDHNFDLMISHYCQDSRSKINPYVFTLRFSLGVASLIKKSFVSIGCGSPLADFLLDGFNVPDMNYPAALSAAIYVIEQVTKFDPRCGGKTMVASAEFHTYEEKSVAFRAETLREDLVAGWVAVIKDIEADIKAEQRKQMSGIMERFRKIHEPKLQRNSNELKSTLGPRSD